MNNLPILEIFKMLLKILKIFKKRDSDEKKTDDQKTL